MTCSCLRRNIGIVLHVGTGSDQSNPMPISQEYEEEVEMTDEALGVTVVAMNLAQSNERLWRPTLISPIAVIASAH